MFFIKEINAKEDLKLMDDIVRHENEVFGDASVGRWNIKPFGAAATFAVPPVGLNRIS